MTERASKSCEHVCGCMPKARRRFLVKGIYTAVRALAVISYVLRYIADLM